MATYLKPRRGRKDTAVSKNIILKKGEVFFEVPDEGVGKGIGKIKMGDGSTPYKDLPYFLEQQIYDFGIATSSKNGLMTSIDKVKLDSVERNANYYTHPYGSGNNHIPSGGSSGQILKWNGDGVATWANNEVVTYGRATQYQDGLMSLDDKIKLDGINQNANFVGIEDSLGSYSRVNALSAYQGKVLNDKAINIDNKLRQIEGNFRDGVDTLYNTCVNAGATPSSKTPAGILNVVDVTSVNRVFICAGFGIAPGSQNIISYNKDYIIVDDYGDYQENRGMIHNFKPFNDIRVKIDIMQMLDRNAYIYFDNNYLELTPTGYANGDGIEYFIFTATIDLKSDIWTRVGSASLDCICGFCMYLDQ